MKFKQSLIYLSLRVNFSSIPFNHYPLSSYTSSFEYRFEHFTILFHLHRKISIKIYEAYIEFEWE